VLERFDQARARADQLRDRADQLVRLVGEEWRRATDHDGER
jgi:hypothetical protein